MLFLSHRVGPLASGQTSQHLKLQIEALAIRHCRGFLGLLNCYLPSRVPRRRDKIAPEPFRQCSLEVQVWRRPNEYIETFLASDYVGQRTQAQNGAARNWSELCALSEQWRMRSSCNMRREFDAINNTATRTAGLHERSLAVFMAVGFNSQRGAAWRWP